MGNLSDLEEWNEIAYSSLLDQIMFYVLTTGKEVNSIELITMFVKICFKLYIWLNET